MNAPAPVWTYLDAATPPAGTLHEAWQAAIPAGVTAQACPPDTPATPSAPAAIWVPLGTDPGWVETWRLNHPNAAIIACGEEPWPEHHLRPLFAQGADDYLARANLEARTVQATVAKAQWRRERRFSGQFGRPFISYLNHDLRAPLNTILGFAGFLGQATQHPTAASYLQGIRRAAEQLDDRIDHLTDLMALQAGDLVLEPRALRPADFIESLRAHEGIELRRAGKRLHLHLHGDLTTTASIDPRRLQEAVAPWLEAAATGTGRIGAALDLEGRRAEDGDVVWELRIRPVLADGRGASADGQRASADSQGMATDQADPLTEAFRAGRPTLAITLARQMIQRLGGSVRLEAGNGDPPTVRLALRLPAGAPAATDAVPATATETTGEDDDPAWQVLGEAWPPEVRQRARLLRQRLLMRDVYALESALETFAPPADLAPAHRAALVALRAHRQQYDVTGLRQWLDRCFPPANASQPDTA